jgi:hypothetical protein
MVTVWAAEPDKVDTGAREFIETAVLGAIGGTNKPWNLAPDGSTFKALWSSTGDWSDKAESSYSVFRSNNFLEIDYPLLVPVIGAQVGAISINIITGALAAQSGEQLDTESGDSILAGRTSVIGGL